MWNVEQPIGYDVQVPRLSWQLAGTQRNIQQVAYQVLVASSPEKLAKQEGDLWNSGKVTGNQSIHIDYNGKPLASRTACYWKVKVWTNKGESAWSTTANWSMGLLNNDLDGEMDWSGKRNALG